MQKTEIYQPNQSEQSERFSEVLMISEAAPTPVIEVETVETDTSYLDLEAVTPTIKSIIWEAASEPVIIADRVTPVTGERLAKMHDIVELEQHIG